ncbi:MAG TPA: hypothetical protein VGU24_01190 [Microvirga sp.]|jgi:hypothetical protein|nr:hypothetical protein [Microvirga sp.]
MKFLILLAALALGAVSAQAQSRLPRTSPAEQNYNDINRSLQRQERNLRVEQQTQFELNQLRQERDRIQAVTPPPTIGGPRICAPGEIGC